MNRYERRPSRVVPLAVVRQIQEQRDALQRRLELLEASLQAEKTSNAELSAQIELLEAEAESRAAPSESDAERRLKEHIAELEADLARIKRRKEEEIAGARVDASKRLLNQIADVRDSVTRALASADTSNPFYEGIQGIGRQVDALLRAEGVELFGEVGEVFDPARHEALSVMSSPNQASGELAYVERQGLVMADGTLVRPAKVVVTA